MGKKKIRKQAKTSTYYVNHAGLVFKILKARKHWFRYCDELSGHVYDRLYVDITHGSKFKK